MKYGRIAAIAVVLALVLLSVAAQPAAANPGTRRESLRAYIDEHYDAVEGGFHLPGSEFSRNEPTFSAVAILDELDVLGIRPPFKPPEDFIKMIEFTIGLQRNETDEEYGGFGESDFGVVDQYTTYNAVNLFHLLSAQDDIPGISDKAMNDTAVLTWINGTQTTSGGFSNQPGGAPDIVSTFYALHTMDAVLHPSGVIEDWLLNETATVEWIMSCREGDAFKLSPASSIAGVTPTAAALMSLNLLEALPSPSEIQSMTDWVLGRQVVSSDGGVLVGGFEESFMSNDTNVASTYWALEVLDLFGQTEGVNDSLAARFVVDSQAVDGSWGLVPGIEVGRLYYAYYAVRSLSLLDQLGMLDEEDPNSPPPPLFDWKTALIIGIIVVAAVGGFMSIRMD
ncbi:MAG: prenyltransferase/squalene oxidase repeat-containing protein [Promethearchaeota archaeon]